MIKNIQYIDPADLAKFLNQEDTILLDVREVGEFTQDHISKAVNLPLSDWDIEKANNICLNKKSVIVYCRSGHRTYVHQEQFAQIQADEVMILNGGILSWRLYQSTCNI